MRSLIALLSLSLCLQACGDGSVAIVVSWGSCDFDRDRWAHADRRERGCMLSSFIDKHHPESLFANEVRYLLGEPTGYSGYQEDTAYLVESASAPQGERLQLLVFRIDQRSGRVTDWRLMPYG